MTDPLTFPPALFGVMSSLIQERSGIHYEESDKDLLVPKIMTRVVEAGFASPLDYYYYLRYDDANRREFDALVETLVVCETYFFREIQQLRVLSDEFIAPKVERGERPRIWCAAAATGEEPLTLAMLLADKGILDRVEIVASDISMKALQRAKEGMYGPRSFRTLDVATKTRWFDTSSELPVVSPELRAAIDWRRVNLVDEAQVLGLGKFDTIVCRNVLIYFDDATVQRVAATLTRALCDQGRLVVGASESLLRFGTLLTCEERAGTFFYHKAA